MKKFLLMLVAFVATMSAFAQNDNDLDIKKGWAAAFKPVAEADDLNGVHVNRTFRSISLVRLWLSPKWQNPVSS